MKIGYACFNIIFLVTVALCTYCYKKKLTYNHCDFKVWVKIGQNNEFCKTIHFNVNDHIYCSSAYRLS